MRSRPDDDIRPDESLLPEADVELDVASGWSARADLVASVVAGILFALAYWGLGAGSVPGAVGFGLTFGAVALLLLTGSKRNREEPSPKDE